MTMIPVSRDDPRVTKAARELELTMIMSAWIHGGVLYIATPYTTCEVPATGFGKTDTLAQSSSRAQAKDHNEVSPRGPKQAASTPAGGSDPPQAPARPDAADPEPPNNPSPPGRGQGEGLDDFTAIDGVGPVTTAKLHDEGLYTYDDLRQYLQTNHEDCPISDRTIAQIEAWLSQRLA